MDISIIFQFLKELAANNNREWFQAHKEEYLRAQAEFEQLLTEVLATNGKLHNEFLKIVGKR